MSDKKAQPEYHDPRTSQKPHTVTGLQLTPGPDKSTQYYFMHLTWTCIPWYARLLGLLRLPYDLVRFVVTGKMMFIPWPWKW